jgi:hypothetical protein
LTFIGAEMFMGGGLPGSASPRTEFFFANFVGLFIGEDGYGASSVGDLG